MKKIGLIGGISWVSTIDYYRYINTMVNERLGGLQYPELLLHSFNYADIKKNNDAGEWGRTLEMIAAASQNMKQGGAEAIVLCANTMHLVADDLQKQIGIPVIHIAEATATEIVKRNVKSVLLLGTKFTMEMDFFRQKLLEKNINVLIPVDEERDFIHRTIFAELGKGELKDETRSKYLSIIQQGQARGAEGVVLGCTEIPLLIKPSDLSVPSFDTTFIHSAAATSFILSDHTHR
jgi:aspartate racemase